MPDQRTVPPNTCDIFCNVVDNYGDIGVTWRLARQLANEHGLAVRLWVDDLVSYAKLCPQADANLDRQKQMGVEVCRWLQDFPLTQPADIVIAAFACKLPESYIEAMAEPSSHSVWINLEYLSAEDWVQGCHGLPSPHPRLPLTKYFFFPGFTKLTGGLLIERDLLARRDAYCADPEAQSNFWRGLGMQRPEADTLKVSLFAYENAALHGLFDVWAQGAQKVLCLVPEGRILPQVTAYFEAHSCSVKNANTVRAEPVEANSESADLSLSSFDKLRTNGCWQSGSLEVRVLPFVAQQDYDPLLWSCDINFVRGEDSCVRAQWAGKPFIWQIYPQHDAVHWEKLQAFLDLYAVGLDRAAESAMQALWKAWNDEADAGAAWPSFAASQATFEAHAQDWSRLLAKNDLALNLLDFCQKAGRMRALKIEGQ